MRQWISLSVLQIIFYFYYAHQIYRIISIAAKLFFKFIVMVIIRSAFNTIWAQLIVMIILIIIYFFFKVSASVLITVININWNQIQQLAKNKN